MLYTKLFYLFLLLTILVVEVEQSVSLSEQ